MSSAGVDFSWLPVSLIACFFIIYISINERFSRISQADAERFIFLAKLPLQSISAREKLRNAKLLYFFGSLGILCFTICTAFLILPKIFKDYSPSAAALLITLTIIGMPQNVPVLGPLIQKLEEKLRNRALEFALVPYEIVQITKAIKNAVIVGSRFGTRKVMFASDPEMYIVLMNDKIRSYFDSDYYDSTNLANNKEILNFLNKYKIYRVSSKNIKTKNLLSPELQSPEKMEFAAEVFATIIASAIIARPRGISQDEILRNFGISSDIKLDADITASQQYSWISNSFVVAILYVMLVYGVLFVFFSDQSFEPLNRFLSNISSYRFFAPSLEYFISNFISEFSVSYVPLFVCFSLLGVAVLDEDRPHRVQAGLWGAYDYISFFAIAFIFGCLSSVLMRNVYAYLGTEHVIWFDGAANQLRMSSCFQKNNLLAGAQGQLFMLCSIVVSIKTCFYVPIVFALLVVTILTISNQKFKRKNANKRSFLGPNKPTIAILWGMGIFFATMMFFMRLFYDIKMCELLADTCGRSDLRSIVSLWDFIKSFFYAEKSTLTLPYGVPFGVIAFSVFLLVFSGRIWREVKSFHPQQ